MKVQKTFSHLAVVVLVFTSHKRTQMRMGLSLAQPQLCPPAATAVAAAATGQAAVLTPADPGSRECS